MHKLKSTLTTVLFLSFLTPLSFGQEFDTPGLQQVITIDTDGYSFEVETVSNFALTDFEFNKEAKKLTIFLDSSVQNNLSEIQIPINLINGNFTFFLNDQEIFPKVQQNEQISFITFEFEGDGKHKLEIIGTTYLPEFSSVAPFVLATSLIGIVFLKRIKIFPIIR